MDLDDAWNAKNIPVIRHATITSWFLAGATGSPDAV
jgi:hypothetical protein